VTALLSPFILGLLARRSRRGNGALVSRGGVMSAV